MSVKDKPKGRGRVDALVKGQNWFASAGLVLLIYAVVWYYLRTYSSFGTAPEDASPLALFLMNLIHVLPVLAGCLLGYGYWDRRRRAEDDRERKRKRYEARMEISRLKREENQSDKAPGGH